MLKRVQEEDIRYSHSVRIPINDTHIQLFGYKTTPRRRWKLTRTHERSKDVEEEGGEENDVFLV